MTDSEKPGSKNEYSQMSLDELFKTSAILGSEVFTAHLQLSPDSQISCADAFNSWAEINSNLSLLLKDRKLNESRAEMIAFEKISKDLMAIIDSLQSRGSKVVNIKDWKHSKGL